MLCLERDSIQSVWWTCRVEPDDIQPGEMSTGTPPQVQGLIPERGTHCWNNRGTATLGGLRMHTHAQHSVPPPEGEKQKLQIHILALSSSEAILLCD